MAGRDAGQAARAIDALVRDLSDPRQVADAYAKGIASELNARAGRTGSPRQAHLLAGAFQVAGPRVSLASYAPAGRGTAGDLVFGADLGSSSFRQFGPRRTGGTWLFPTLRDPGDDVTRQGEAALDDLVAGAL